MGWISDRAMRTGHGLNPNPKNNGSDKGPLRKVVDIVTDPQFKNLTMELLECGHRQRAREDIIGHRPASRRRCRQCKKENPVHDYPAIMRAILDLYILPVRGLHGVEHWARVLTNGLRIAAKTDGVDREVVTLFALFHDACRVNENTDANHGFRGGSLAEDLRGTLVHLDDRRFKLLFEACRLHTDGLTTGEPTLLACWDADRLDLGRVGITPRASRLCTEAGRDILSWANARAVRGFVPKSVLAGWGLDSDLC